MPLKSPLKPSMELKSLAERELIRAIRRSFASPGKRLILGIGDDAAVIRGGNGHNVLTTDLLVEDFHFIRAIHPPFFLGRKSLSVNLSDIAAMGARPRFALLGLGLPPRIEIRWVREFFSGFKSAGDEYQVILVGGDLSQASKIFISVTVIGEGRTIIRRSGGRPGDSIFVSGFLGDAAGGLHLSKKGFILGKNKKADYLLKAFMDPAPQIALGLELSRRRLASSLIDSSDGLSVDLLHLCEESGVGAEIEIERLPISSALRFFEKNPVLPALHGGEDYQLVFSVPPRRFEAVKALQAKFRITPIGRMTRSKGIFIIDRRGRRRPLEPGGYEHFKN